MKKWMKSLILVVSLTAVMAEDRTFPVGSLIIPMDSQNQDELNDGIFEAYGLVYEMLQQGITVHAIIKEDKVSNSEPDLVTTDVGTTVVSGNAFVPVSPLPQQYAGGPFMVDASDASDLLGLISASSPLYDHVVVHQFDEPVTAPVGATFQTTPRQIALMNNAGNEGQSLLACYLELAGVPAAYYTILEPSEIAAGDLSVAAYYILWVPHWTPAGELLGTTVADTIMANVNAFADDGGNVLFTCKSIDAWEASASLLSESYLGINGTVTQPTVYENFDLPFSQIGDYPFVVDETLDTQQFRNWQSGDTPATGSSGSGSSTWRQNVNTIAHDSTPTNPWVYYAMRNKDSDPNKGNVHYISGHRYVSCEPIISPGVTYRIDITMKSCRRNAPEFWSHSGAAFDLTLEYDGGEGSLDIGSLAEGVFSTWSNPDFSASTIDGRTNYGPGCNGAGSPAGTDHLSGIFIQNLSTTPYRITNITASFDCGCSDDYVFQGLSIQVDNGACGTSSCSFCSDVYPDFDPRNCDDDGTVSFVPVSKKGGGTDVIFSGGTGDPSDPGEPRPQNVGGIRYILNTLFNNIVDPIEIAEYARSGPVIDNDVLYYGTFEYPGNAGHFRAYDIADADGNSASGNLTEKWDASGFGVMPVWSSRYLFTSINGSLVEVHENNANIIEAFINDPTDTVASVAEDIKNFRGQFRAKRLGGVERSTPAIVPPNVRSNNSRPAIAYVGTTYGVLEFIDLETGEEQRGYVPAAVLHKLKNTRVDDADRPKVDSSPTVLDAFLPVDINDPTGARDWRTIVAVGHGSGAKGMSVLDVTDPTNPAVLWTAFNTANFGFTQRVSVARYKKEINSTFSIGYAAIMTTNDPNNVLGHGLRIYAFDLQTGAAIWSQPFVRNYNLTGQNDLPAPAAVADLNDDGFDDSLLVGDLNGRLWRIDISTGNALPASSQPSSTPLFDASVGATPNATDRPIAAAPSVGEYSGHAVVAFGTGGTDWSHSTNNVVVVYDLKDESLLIPPIDLGTLKLYSSVSFAGGKIFFVAVSGSLNSANPTLDLPDPDDLTPSAYVYSVNLDPANNTTSRVEFTKSRASVYVKNGQVFGGSIDGTFKGFNDRQEQETIRAFKQLIWRNLSNQAGTP